MLLLAADAAELQPGDCSFEAVHSLLMIHVRVTLACCMREPLPGAFTTC